MTQARLIAAGLFLLLLGLAHLLPQSHARTAPLEFEAAPAVEKSGAAPAAPRTESERSTREEFRQFLNASFLSLGRDSANETASADDKAGFSPELLRSSNTLGELADRLERDPQFWNDAAKYYQKCAADDGILLPVRAVCYRHLVEGAATGESPFDDSGVSRDVKDLAARLN